MYTEKEYVCQVAKTVEEGPNVVSVYLEPQGEELDFKAGQYLTIKFPGLTPDEGKAYSISSAPYEKYIRITVRKIGRFSSAFFDLKVGDTVTTSAPFGYFYPEPEDTNRLIFVVGGIGITPCLSIIKDLTKDQSDRQLDLFYSNRTEADAVFKDELNDLTKNNPHLAVHHFITRETPKAAGYHAGRITPEAMANTIGNLSTAEFFLCGSMNFTKDLWKSLRATNIPPHQLYTEGFF